MSNLQLKVQKMKQTWSICSKCHSNSDNVNVDDVEEGFCKNNLNCNDHAHVEITLTLLQ